jgi:gliding motility-associated-like protein
VTLDFNTSFVSAEFDMPDTVCMPAVVNFNNQSTNVTTYSWNFGDGNTSTTASPTNTFPGPGVYQVTLITANPTSCNKFDTAQHSISVFPSPTADFTWVPNPPTPNTPNVFTNLSTGATHYLWDFGDGVTSVEKDPIHVFEKDGTYQVCLSAYNDVGCQDTACKSVRGIVVPIVDVPTGFTPNGDGINDFVFVRGYGIESMTFRIFNRWGEKVFETTDKKTGWDGTYKGVKQEMEVYQYTLDVQFFDDTHTFKKGNITLLK